jgi:hypothetical protein
MGVNCLACGLDIGGIDDHASRLDREDDDDDDDEVALSYDKEKLPEALFEVC